MKLNRMNINKRAGQIITDYLERYPEARDVKSNMRLVWYVYRELGCLGEDGIPDIQHWESLPIKPWNLDRRIRKLKEERPELDSTPEYRKELQEDRYAEFANPSKA